MSSIEALPIKALLITVAVIQIKALVMETLLLITLAVIQIKALVMVTLLLITLAKLPPPITTPSVRTLRATTPEPVNKPHRGPPTPRRRRRRRHL